MGSNDPDRATPPHSARKLRHSLASPHLGLSVLSVSIGSSRPATSTTGSVSSSGVAPAQPGCFDAPIRPVDLVRRHRKEVPVEDVHGPAHGRPLHPATVRGSRAARAQASRSMPSLAATAATAATTVERPDPCAGQQRRGEQLHVDPADAAAHESAALEERRHLIDAGDRRRPQRAQEREHGGAVREPVARQLADHPRMRPHLRASERSRDPGDQHATMGARVCRDRHAHGVVATVTSPTRWVNGSGRDVSAALADAGTRSVAPIVPRHVRCAPTKAAGT